MSPTDQALVERAKQGESAAFVELWARYEAPVRALCRRYLACSHRDPAVDEHDLAMDTFVRALHALDQYEDRSAAGYGFETWLLEVAKRLCLKFLAKQRRRAQWTAPVSGDEASPEPPDEGPATEEIVQQRELLRLAAQAINALPDLYRRPFKLLLEEYPQKEIAAALGLSVDGVAKRIARARTLLQPRLELLLGQEWSQAARGAARRAARARLRTVERALAEIVSDHRIVAIILPSGGEMQLCLRVDPRLAAHAPAIEARRRELASRPRAWKQRLDLAEICYHSGRWEEARQLYREALSIYPGCYAAALRLGRMLEHEQQTAEAARVYADALQHAPPAAVIPLQAHLLAVEGKDEEAMDHFRQAVALAPREKESYYGLVRVLGRLSRYEEQLETMAQVRAFDPEDLAAVTGAYTPCARLRRFDLARPLLERAVSIDPNSPTAVQHLFQVRMNLGLYDAETLALAERLVRLAPEFVASWSELAWIYAELGRDEESLAVLRHYLEEHPHNAEALCALAWRHHYLRQVEETLAFARQAYALDPQDEYVCWTLLTAYGPPSSAVSEAEAVELAEAMAARFPRDSAILRAVAILYLQRGHGPTALQYAQRALALSPASREIQILLADMYTQLGRWREAADTYERLVAASDDRPTRILAPWGRALKALNDPGGDALLAEAAARARTAADYLQLGKEYTACGQRDAAIAAFSACLARAPLPAYARRAAEVHLQRLLAPDDPEPTTSQPK
jgi:RNA polymerase sigma factor (sigma-70 family)